MPLGRLSPVLFVPVAAAILFAAPAVAQQSVYTDLDLSTCPQMPVSRGTDQPPVWVCPGYSDYWVMVLQVEDHFYVSYSRFFPDIERAIYQTLEPRNRINNVLEWRLDDTAEPVATILRYYLPGMRVGAVEDEVLLVTRISPTCHIAHIRASTEIAPANELARQVADLVPPGFYCDGQAPLLFSLADMPGYWFYDLPYPTQPTITQEIRDFVRSQIER